MDLTREATDTTETARKVVDDLIADKYVPWSARVEAERRVRRTLEEGKGR